MNYKDVNEVFEDALSAMIWKGDQQFANLNISELQDLISIDVISSAKNALVGLVESFAVNEEACKELVDEVGKRGIDIDFPQQVSKKIEMIPKKFSKIRSVRIEREVNKLMHDECDNVNVYTIAQQANIPLHRAMDMKDIVIRSLECQQGLNFATHFFENNSLENIIKLINDNNIKTDLNTMNNSIVNDIIELHCVRNHLDDNEKRKLCEKVLLIDYSSVNDFAKIALQLWYFENISEDMLVGLFEEYDSEVISWGVRKWYKQYKHFGLFSTKYRFIER